MCEWEEAWGGWPGGGGEAGGGGGLRERVYNYATVCKINCVLFLFICLFPLSLSDYVVGIPKGASHLGKVSQFFSLFFFTFPLSHSLSLSPPPPLAPCFFPSSFPPSFLPSFFLCTLICLFIIFLFIFDWFLASFIHHMIRPRRLTVFNQQGKYNNKEGEDRKVPFALGLIVIVWLFAGRHVYTRPRQHQQYHRRAGKFVTP